MTTAHYDIIYYNNNEINNNKCVTLPAHIPGTMLLNRLADISSRACDITTNPFSAFSMSFSELCSTFNNLLYLCYIKKIIINNLFTNVVTLFQCFQNKSSMCKSLNMPVHGGA